VFEPGVDGREAVRVDWLLLAALGIMWVAFLWPTDRRRPASARSVEEFERRMELLAQVEANGTEGRWIVTPRKGARFVGVAERKRARARERRRKVLVFLLESIGLTFLIGLVPPLRLVWMASAALVGLLLVYVSLLVWVKNQSQHPHEVARAARQPARVKTPATAVPRYVVEGMSGRVRATFNGLGQVGPDDRVHVVVRPAGSTAGA
jgi:Flp pilus assembly protein TadB